MPDPRTWTLLDGRGDPTVETAWLDVQREAGMTIAEQRASRAARLGITVDEWKARRQAAMQAQGLPPHEGDLTTRVGIDTAADQRPDWIVCAACIRTMRKTKGGRIEVRPGALVCPCCASRPQTCPVIVADRWLADRRDFKTACIVADYRVNPADHQVAAVETFRTTLTTDVDGLPLGVQREPVIGVSGRVLINTYWSMVAERGRGVL